MLTAEMPSLALRMATEAMRPSVLRLSAMARPAASSLDAQREPALGVERGEVGLERDGHVQSLRGCSPRARFVAGSENAFSPSNRVARGGRQSWFVVGRGWAGLGSALSG